MVKQFTGSVGRLTCSCNPKTRFRSSSFLRCSPYNRDKGKRPVLQGSPARSFARRGIRGQTAEDYLGAAKMLPCWAAPRVRDEHPMAIGTAMEECNSWWPPAIDVEELQRMWKEGRATVEGGANTNIKPVVTARRSLHSTTHTGNNSWFSYSLLPFIEFRHWTKSAFDFVPIYRGVTCTRTLVGLAVSSANGS